MKTSLKFSLLLFLFAIFSCDSVDELTKFNINYDAEVTIPSTTIINTPFEVGTPGIQSNSSSKFSENNTRKDLIESVKLTELKLEITNPSSGNFNFLKEIKLFIDAEGLEKKQIAIKTNIPNNDVSVLLLDVGDEELKEYIKLDSFELSVTTTTDETIEEAHDIKIGSTFFVDAKVFGI